MSPSVTLEFAARTGSHTMPRLARGAGGGGTRPACYDCRLTYLLTTTPQSDAQFARRVLICSKTQIEAYVSIVCRDTMDSLQGMKLVAWYASATMDSAGC